MHLLDNICLRDYNAHTAAACCSVLVVARPDCAPPVLAGGRKYTLYTEYPVALFVSQRVLYWYIGCIECTE